MNVYARSFVLRPPCLPGVSLSGYSFSLGPPAGGPTAISRHGKEQHGLLAKNGQLIIWSWGQVWIREDAMGSSFSREPCPKRPWIRRPFFGHRRRVLPAEHSSEDLEVNEPVDIESLGVDDLLSSSVDDPMFEAIGPQGGTKGE